MARGNGEGSIYKRNDGRWCGQITIGTDPQTGKPKRKYIYGDKKREVARKMTDLKKKLFDGTYVEPSKMKLSEWLNDWIKGRKNSLAYNTYNSYKTMIDRHINPEIGAIKLKDLKTRQIQSLLNEKLENGRVKGEGGLSQRTVKYIYQTLHVALKQAVKENMIPKNICKAVEVPKKQEVKELQTWNKDQVNKFLETAKDFKYYILHYLALNTGMRQGELLGLKWKDINFSKKRLEVIRQYDRSKEFKKLKTKSGNRTLPLTDAVIKKLKRHKIIQSEKKLALGDNYKDYNLVCCNDIGEPIYYRSLYGDFKKTIKAAELPEITFHDMRHTFATLFLESGGDITVLQQILGHSSITVTIDTYSHVTEDMLTAAANKMESMYETAKSK